jgi:MFS family permease
VPGAGCFDKPKGMLSMSIFGGKDPQSGASCSTDRRPNESIVETNIPARLDRLPWGRFHTRVVVALGITWVLDGLEVTIAGAISGALKQSPSLHFSNADVGIASSAYLAGAVLGAIFFGWLTDRLGRKRLFFITLAVYLVATAATAFSWNLASFVLFRLFTGAGIGGEYTAINSTIQELVPARYRGWTDLVINGSFWIGAAIGAAVSIALLDPRLFDPDFGWRLAFLIGAVLGLVILVMRFWIPESPRWLMVHHSARLYRASLYGCSRLVEDIRNIDWISSIGGSATNRQRRAPFNRSLF